MVGGGSLGRTKTTCCAELAIRDHLRRRDLAFDRNTRRRGILELRTRWAGRPIRVQWLAPPRSDSEARAGCCGASFVRVDVGEVHRSPVRWAVCCRGPAEQPDQFALQVTSGAGWLSLATSFPCRAGGARGFEPIEGLFAALEAMAAIQGGTVIGLDSAWDLEDWSLPQPRPGRDQWLLGVGTLATAALAIPLYSVVQIAEASIAWAVAAGFTGLGFIGFSTIQQRIARPEKEAKLVAGHLTKATSAPQVWGPRTADTFQLPVVVHRAGGRQIGFATISSTLVRARSSDAELRVVVRAIDWPDQTDRRCRLVPSRWLAAELRGERARQTEPWLQKELAPDATRTVFTPGVARTEALARAMFPSGAKKGA